jgi:hypothetical protein
MQHMNTKRCSGHKKHWECADEYPNHMVPVSEFHLSSTRGRSDGIQGMCKKCFSYSDKIRWKRRPKHPVTGEVKKNWKHRIALSYGGVHGAPFWQSYLDAAEGQWQKEVSRILTLDLSPNQRRAKRTLPKVDRPKSVRITTKKVVDSRGYVYVFKDHMKSNDLYKIGASHEPQERLDQANTWGDFESIYESEEVADCAKLEKEVHQSLRKYQVKGEWFKVTEDLAINTIKELVNENFSYAVAS